MHFTGERLVPEEGFCGQTTRAFKEHKARYDFASKFVSAKKVLDIACGSGYGSKILLDAGASEVHGCDISKEAIDYAKIHYNDKSIFFNVMNVSEINFPDVYFDCIVSFETIEHIHQYDKAVQEFGRLLKEDGILILSTPNKEITSKGKDKPDNPFHVKEFTKDELTELLKTNFSSIHLYSQLLLVNVGIFKKLLRSVVHNLVKLDFFKLHTRVLSEKICTMIGEMVDNTNQIFEPIKYERHQQPLIFIAVCRKK